MKTLFRCFVIFTFIFIFAFCALVLLSLQTQPKTVQLHQISAQKAKQSQQLVKKLITSAKQQGQQQVRITKDELDGLAALLHRAVPQSAANVTLTPKALNASLSVTLPLPELIKYLNVSIKVLPSERGLMIEQVNIGHLSLAGHHFITLVRLMSDFFIQPNLVDDMLAIIKRVSISESFVEFDMYFDTRLLARNNDKSLLMRLRDDLSLFGNAKEIAIYYQSIAQYAAKQQSNASLAGYVREVFSLASQRSNSIANTNTTVQNQSAAMALIIYFGADRFELLVGDIIDDDFDQLVVRNKLRSNATLRGRNDLQKHFVYSMAIQMFSTLGASDAIGEYKEFLDSNRGGSGFSFADLMADRAGTRFAQIVVASENKAKRAQSLLLTITDEALLPSIQGLNEGISQTEFEQTYRDINNQDYQQMLKEIDARLETLPLYQLGW
ncbi:hypothetical protein [Thalassotalea sp. PP2-459]|uniref:hypothetical protein n=1 Tax=Thalassotalea sp. PP2-459 TaxID=1742724 RepID=UPI0009440BD6|nr:hypothetical protein [Thalassotalea sp. PP2-459]OKY27083.1 hypothetical protein BI291_10040 [Thalassotalea sp. PP2-459]